MLLITGEWIAAWTLIGIGSVIGVSWRPFRRFRERRHLQQRLRAIRQGR